MAVAAVRAEGLGKQYQIGARRDRYDTLRDSLARGARQLLVRRRVDETTRFWALRDVSFEIAPGEVVGVIGRNGAGKTTLLRLLARITYPTAGEAEIRGRLGSLLEVGTGFHPELTGRENVFLNGAVLGMRRREIAQKFDDIVEFAGVEKFLETPVKRYSSGMHVRLAFSVAAHLEPEVLLVDEVLAVGDAEFQRRCLGKMESVGRSGRTVFFVSHSMQAIEQLCPRTLLLEDGRLVEDGPTDSVVARYLQGAHGSPAERVWAKDESPGDVDAVLRSVRVVDASHITTISVDVREPVGIEMTFESLRGSTHFVPWLILRNEQAAHVFSAMDIDPRWRKPVPKGRYTTTAWIPGNLLNEGTMFVSVSLNTFASGGRAVVHASAENVVSFHVFDPAEGDSARGNYVGAWAAPVRPLLTWTYHDERVA
jgi:lipopolysaccharide transport system ATP-binding protein